MFMPTTISTSVTSWPEEVWFRQVYKTKITVDNFPSIFLLNLQDSLAYTVHTINYNWEVNLSTKPLNFHRWSTMSTTRELPDIFTKNFSSETIFSGISLLILFNLPRTRKFMLLVLTAISTRRLHLFSWSTLLAEPNTIKIKIYFSIVKKKQNTSPTVLPLPWIKCLLWFLSSKVANFRTYHMILRRKQELSSWLSTEYKMNK